MRRAPSTGTRTRPIFVEIRIRASIERVWQLTQDTDLHPRWDLRFSRISRTAELEGGGYRFRYERAVGPHTIVGTGTSIGEHRRDDGTRTSALRFDTSAGLSPIGDGRGYWRYRPGRDAEGDLVIFTTGFDYVPGWGAVGRVLDRILTRRLVSWATAWSFDRLRIWAESDVEPERWPAASVLAVWRRDRPRAARCVTKAATRNVMAEAPGTLDRLDAP